MHGSIHSLERDAFVESPLHRIDARIKLIFVFAVVLTATIFNNVYLMVLMEIYMLFVMLFSKIPILNLLKRIIMIIPFGGFIALFQPFIRGESVIYYLGMLPIYSEGLDFGISLFLKFLVSITSVVLLSSTTPMYEVINAGKKLGIPSIMSTLLGMMIRYLFVMVDVLESTIKAQKSRALNRKNLNYKQLLNTFGSLIGLVFLKSYEQGERTYLGMLSRGYSKDSNIKTLGQKIGFNDVLFLSTTTLILSIGIISF
ncbi:cobalt ABC transporter, inner membrane subunit CbiQ [Methanococcus maripaludis X1]|uniref:Cobalt ABC transporter, inner membrane subunit CbiQ n=1 Tax=Methanococcus maripaludis X1 TaxID=1053692 RepID=G0H013_METMI|nr:cobalt ECF transporter T component CbiQ [Methanococcus maripaludis]AEK19894.1 cobalt ABC transporter, inner membrane subunit CbiQ [Methanococcus maripaludis X1]